ncbi:thiamine pyrophosphate-binding protein [Thiolinea disciformis]|uniref:thiamine pyrophosphate-binding protein n=1 Tax=Thiolinea disciformis TaxID=125614 RepID=UPI0003771005|nr:thiamine pyrophosphate-binding protein [Thiolinea disciformis]
MTRTQRSGGQILVDCLLKQQVDTVFGVPGESYLAVLDALHDVKGRIKTIMTRQEGGAAFMAVARAKLTGKTQVCMVTRGPGATNASIGIHTAMQDSAPLVVFIGHVGRAMLQREAFQEIDFGQMFASLTKWVVQINEADRIPELVARAFKVAQSGRPGPVIVVLPEDMLRDTSAAHALAATPLAEPTLDSLTQQTVIQALEKAQRPVLLVGGSGWTDEGKWYLKQFAETNHLPVVAAFRCLDLLDNYSPSYTGDCGLAVFPNTLKLLQTADLVLAVGVRFGEITTQGYTLFKLPKPEQTLIHVHVSDNEIGKVYQADLAIHCGSNAFFKALASIRLQPANTWQAYCAQARADFMASIPCPSQPGSLDLAEIMAWLRANLPKDVIITNGAGNFATWPTKYFLYGEKARLLAPMNGAMGFGVPAAIAAKLSYPEKVVVGFTGDGDFLMNGQELATATQYACQPIILLVNNSMYGTIRMHQEKHYPSRVHGTELKNPDFVQLANAYGFHAERISNTADFPAAFQRALSAKQGTLLELVIDPEGISPKMTISGLRGAAQY